MVQLKDIAKEKPRVELKDLPPEQELLYVSEKIKDKEASKTGGLVITYRQKDGKEFGMKYSGMHGEVLYNALRDLGMHDTQDLGKGFMWYKLVQFRMGFPRYIPTGKRK